MTAVPDVVHAHLAAVTGDAEALRAVRAPRGVLEFPYAFAGVPARLEGIDALLGYFGGPKRFGTWTFSGFRAVGEGRLHAVELHGEATHLETGTPYVQDYVVWVETDEEGRIARWREYWDPGRAPGSAGLGAVAPALPARDVAASAAYLRERFGFRTPHEDAGFAVMLRDRARIHLWEAGDESWRTRPDRGERPVVSGAESFLAGTASCRVEVGDVDALYAELRAAGVLHPVSQDGVSTTDFGTREFAALDLDGNLLEFYRWQA